ncbi:hypothetical protein LCGC14_0456750 [marine sediment metagenome]|uniref:Uncharacterized protein n=1 Tax=marine sediment metagenome TaxID=412755 RepID=A0A0F9VQ54_9ZZZZ
MVEALAMDDMRSIPSRLVRIRGGYGKVRSVGMSYVKFRPGKFWRESFEVIKE